MKLNIGCGTLKLDGYVNIDVDSSLEPDLVLNVSNQKLPYERGSVDEVIMFHTIEHICRDYHVYVLANINRVLKMGSKLIISYPEFVKCAKNFFENFQGQRVFWESTILGRGNTVYDHHNTLMFSVDFIPLLREHGFGKVTAIEEERQPFNTFIEAVKTFEAIEMEDLLRKEVVDAR